MSTASEKGRVLEDSVECIERTILKSVHDATSFTIEPRKRIVADGVTHEIDLHVTVHTAPGYETLVIFECKNWKQKVGKNEIIVFSEKIDVASAQRGFFVATAFTEDAVAQAAKDKRIILQIADIETGEKLAAPNAFHVIVVRYTREDLTLTPSPALQDGPIEGHLATHRGAEMPLSAYVAEWRSELECRITDSFPSDVLGNGIYPQAAVDTRETNGSLVVDGIEIASATLNIAFDIHVIFPQLSVSVGDRGAAFHIDASEAAGGTIRVIASATRQQP
jgi:hypothetical protein